MRFNGAANSGEFSNMLHPLDVESSVQTGDGNCPEFDGGEYNNNIERGEAEFNIVVLRSINTEC